MNQIAAENGRVKAVQFHAQIDNAYLNRLGTENVYSADIGQLLHYLKFPFFHGIEFSFLQDISTLFSTETCNAGDTIVREGEKGEKGDKFYMIVRGKLEIRRSHTEAEDQRVAVLEDGDHFGEIALLRGIARTASVRAMEPSVLLSLRREAFLELTAKYPQILKAVEHMLLERISR